MIITFTNGARSDGSIRTSGMVGMSKASGVSARSRGVSTEGGYKG